MPVMTMRPLLTVGQLSRHPDLAGWSRGQLEYVLRDIEPVQRAGILRMYDTNQVPLIRSALQRTARTRPL